MPAADRHAASERIGTMLAALPLYRAARTVMFFLTHGSEVETAGMIAAALGEGKTVVLPRIDAETDSIRSCRITDLSGDLMAGKYGIREPIHGRCPEVPAAQVDLVIVPAVAFDRAGHRVGYGKGYYDRWLSSFTVRQRVGIAFEKQIVDKIAHDAHDMPVGMIVTDRRVITVDGRADNERRCDE